MCIIRHNGRNNGNDLSQSHREGPLTVGWGDNISKLCAVYISAMSVATAALEPSARSTGNDAPAALCWCCTTVPLDHDAPRRYDWGVERETKHTHHPGRRRLYVVFHIFFKSRHHAPFFQVDQSAVNVIATCSLIWESYKQDAPGPESKGLKAPVESILSTETDPKRIECVLAWKIRRSLKRNKINKQQKRKNKIQNSRALIFSFFPKRKKDQRPKR